MEMEQLGSYRVGGGIQARREEREEEGRKTECQRGGKAWKKNGESEKGSNILGREKMGKPSSAHLGLGERPVAGEAGSTGQR